MNSTNFTNQIDQLIEEKSLLKHPFYKAWSAGELTLESLRGYAFEYFQLVKAVPEYMDDILECLKDEGLSEESYNELMEHRQEEHDHIELWVKFASSLGINREELFAYKGLDKTNKSVEDLRNLMNDFKGGSSAMYALEKELPKISNTKLDGLKEFYNLTSEDSKVYFEEHAEADIRHAASWKNIIKEEKDAKKKEELVTYADKSLDSQNLLLDSCFEAYC